MIEVRQTEIYSKWFDSLRDRQARARIDIRIRRLSIGNFGDVKPVGEGVSELRIDYGPGYRVYFAQRARELVILYWLAVTNAVRKLISKPRYNYYEYLRRTEHEKG